MGAKETLGGGVSTRLSSGRIDPDRLWPAGRQLGRVRLSVSSWAGLPAFACPLLLPSPPPSSTPNGERKINLKEN